MKNVSNTTILQNLECVDCGWAIINMCCNDQDEPFALWDWWQYCSNKSCRNHFGEGVFQNTPEFIIPTLITDHHILRKDGTIAGIVG